MRAVIMSIGSELLGGFLTDTNSTFLAQDMAAAGIELVGVMQVGDDLDRIVHTLNRATEDAELVVITGGVGPTEDDLTREAIAEFAGEEVRVDPDLLKGVERFFASRGITMPPRNEKQAWLIPSAEALPNPVGTAPGWFVRHNGRMIVSMPGVPREMARMWRDQVMPRLGDSLGNTAIVSSTVKTIGIGESSVEDMVSHIIHRGHPVVATYAKDDGVHIRITASDLDRATAEKLVRDTELEIHEIFGAHAYGKLDTRIGEVILGSCAQLGVPLMTYEAGSAGRITNLLAEETEFERWFAGGVVEQFRTSAMHHRIDPDTAEAATLLAQAICERSTAADSEPRAVAVIAVRFDDNGEGERRPGSIALRLEAAGRVFERQHQVEASPTEIRRRAALWGSEFLHVSLVECAAGIPSE